MKKIIRITESDLIKIVKKVLSEDVNPGGINIGTNKGKLSVGGCSYDISALGFNVGHVDYVKDKGGEYEVRFDGKTKLVDKQQVNSQIGKFRGCPSRVEIEYEVSSFLPNIDITFTKV
jgi:hypothetical protein